MSTVLPPSQVLDALTDMRERCLALQSKTNSSHLLWSLSRIGSLACELQSLLSTTDSEIAAFVGIQHLKTQLAEIEWVIAPIPPIQSLCNAAVV